ncbi:MAG: VIT1/CCC1 transporter family protein [Candidatus Omnitrophica bacterium]|nr:VIT1/CCC1 transporter family protein [Candidatus Omnitrophota bacterium]
MLSPNLKKQFLSAQKNEITEHVVYKQLARVVKNDANAQVLEKISAEELAHYEYFRAMTGEDVRPDHWKAVFYANISRMLGLNFGLKLMENGEGLAQDTYNNWKAEFPKIDLIMQEEKEHEAALLNLINEDRLNYVSSVILGLNDALIELTATVAGFTLALQNTKLIGMLGLITGIAAAMSMAASEYLATKHEAEAKDPLKASIYTGLSYIGAVAILVLPYFLLSNIFLCLIVTISLSLIIILIFTFYTSVAQGLDFKGRFWEMAILSVGIAGVTFLIGLAARKIFGITV